MTTEPTERQRKGVDGEGPRAKDLKKAGVDAGVDLETRARPEPVKEARDDLIPIEQGKEDEETV